MKTTLTVQYALLCIQEMSRQEESPLSCRELSDRQGIPLPECEAILGQLKDAAIVEENEAGRFSLAQPVESIKAFELLKVLGSPRKKATPFKMLYEPRRLALSKTLEAVAWAQSMAAYPSEGALQ